MLGRPYVATNARLVRMFPQGMQIQIAGRSLALAQGDITDFAADVIVNAANSRLAGGGGVDGAIHRAGGPSLMAELDEIRARLGGCDTGDAVVTGAGALPAKWVVHAVGPVYRDGRQDEPDQLASCYRRAMDLAADRKANSIAFPSISTGVYGYPLDAAARIALSTVAERLAIPSQTLRVATFVLFGREAFDAHAAALEGLA